VDIPGEDSRKNPQTRNGEYEEKIRMNKLIFMTGGDGHSKKATTTGVVLNDWETALTGCRRGPGKNVKVTFETVHPRRDPKLKKTKKSAACPL